MRNEADAFCLIETGVNNQEGLQGEESLQDKEGSETADEDWDYYMCRKGYSNKRKGQHQ